MSIDDEIVNLYREKARTSKIKPGGYITLSLTRRGQKATLHADRQAVTVTVETAPGGDVLRRYTL